MTIHPWEVRQILNLPDVLIVHIAENLALVIGCASIAAPHLAASLG